MEKTPFDEIVIARLKGKAPDLSSIDPLELLSFAAREAYYHIRSRAPNIDDNDPCHDKARMASFVCEALEAAIERASAVPVSG
jgi:hypothetical protein